MKLLLIDGNSIVNRAFYGIRMLNAPDGTPTNGIYGFLAILQRIAEAEKPDGIAVTFDLHAPTFRHLQYADYKGTRKGMPEELQVQMPILKQVLDAMGVLRLEQEGWEADDLLGTLSRRCEAEGVDCVIVTGDKDSFQLITEHTRVLHVKTRMGQTETVNYTPARFREEYGFEPARMIDLKALMGDTSDNIPGVPGCGEKTAIALVQEYETIDALYAAMPEVNAKPAMLQKLKDGEESARHSYWLATIVTDAPLEFKPEDNLRQPFQPELYDLFLRLEFLKLIEKYNLKPTGEAVKPREESVTEMFTVTEAADAEKWLEKWRGPDSVTVYFLPDLSGVAVDDDESMVQVFAGTYAGDWNEFLKNLCAPDIHKTGHNVKDLLGALLEQGIRAEGFDYDTALGAYLLDATAGDYDIGRLFIAYFNAELMKPIHLKADAFSLLGDVNMAQAAFASYCTAIAALREYQEPRLRENDMWRLFSEVEMPLCAVLADMERNGMRCDAKALYEFGELLRTRMEELEQGIYETAGGKFNINSPKQLGKVLFEDLQLPHGKKTKTGWSTNAEVLDKLRYEAPIVAEILEYRQVSKLKSTYADGLLKAIDPDGRVRTSFQMTVTDTGRLSSREPNLQNIPTRTELGSEIRRLFIADEGCVLVDADYSQIELRLLSHIADDKVMQEAFRSGEDFHTVTAAKVFRTDNVTPELRRRAKAVNFGIVYGISAFSLSQDIGVSMAEAKEYMEQYFATYQGVRQYMTDVVEQAKQRGYVETLWHRRRDLPEIKNSNFNLRAFGERVALNMPIQGTAADIMKLAMVRVYERLRREKLRARLIMQVHDELIVECPAEEQETVKRLLAEEMERSASLSVPLIAEAHSGKNWLEAKG